MRESRKSLFSTNNLQNYKKISHCIVASEYLYTENTKKPTYNEILRKNQSPSRTQNITINLISSENKGRVYHKPYKEVKKKTENNNRNYKYQPAKNKQPTTTKLKNGNAASATEAKKKISAYSK